MAAGLNLRAYSMQIFWQIKAVGIGLVEACAFPLPHSQGALHRR
uniref:Uncharacterized protein n=1 Tax=Anguilla anguilla TaxID=7936 RepID=A0A0E9UZY5_ANGAN